MNIGTSQITVPSGGWTQAEGSYLWYGSYNDSFEDLPVIYRVLKINDDGTALIDCDEILFADMFFAAGGNDKYASSDIYAYLKDGKARNGTSLFTDKEKAQVVPTNLTAREQYRPARFETSKYYYTDDASEGNLSFLLSGQEANDLYPDDAASAKTGRYYQGSSYWLRSAGPRLGVHNQNYTAATVGRNYLGNWNLGYSFVNSDLGGVSPASNVNLSNILFTSDCNQSKGTTAGELEQIGTTTSQEWQVTLKDTTKTVTVQTGSASTQGDVTKITVPFTASSSDGEAIDQISIVITNGDISSSSSEVLYYGKLDTTDVSGGTGTFTLPTGLPDGYKIYAMAEDVNEAGHTDYASEPVEVTFTQEVKEYTVTFDSNGGTEVPAEKVQENQKATKPADPTKEGYTFTGWYYDGSAFDFDTPITKDMTLTAVWEKNAEPEPTPEPEPDADDKGGDASTPSTMTTSTVPTIAQTGDSVGEVLIAGLVCTIAAGALWAVLLFRRRNSN